MTREEFVSQLNMVFDHDVVELIIASMLCYKDFLNSHAVEALECTTDTRVLLGNQMALLDDLVTED
jgi:hypothetical protein